MRRCRRTQPATRPQGTSLALKKHLRGKNPEHCYAGEKNGKRYDVLDASGKLAAHWAL
jgi:hypothetical protein